MSQEEENSDDFVNDLEQLLEDCEENEEESKTTSRRLNKKSVHVSDSDQDFDDFVEPTTNFNDKIEKKKKQKKTKDDESNIQKKKKRKQADSEIKEMWDSITNDSNFKKDDDNVILNCAKKDEDDHEIDTLFKMGKKKRKKEKSKEEIAMQVEEVIANLEIAVEDDIELNKEGKPAINKLMKLPFLNEALSKKQLQVEYLDHGVLNVLKNWLEPLPDGSLPNINIRTAILKILNDLHINLDQDCRREQLIKSGLGKVIMFLSKSDEETTPNRRLAHDLVNKWGYIIYNKSTRYENMCTPEEREKQHQLLLTRQNKKTLNKVSETKVGDFDVDVDFSVKPNCKLAASKGIGRARVPTPIAMDFVIRPESKIDKRLESRVKMQIDNSYTHDNIISRLQKKKAIKRKGLQATKPSADGRTMLKYL